MPAGTINLDTRIHRRQLLKAQTLRSLSQKNLMDIVNKEEPIGLLVNNELSIAMLSWGKYEELIERMTEKDRLIEDLQSQIEDVLLNKHVGQAVLNAESGKNEEYTVGSLSDVFNHIED
ncbi:hypothetical protein [Planococcus sp. ISL-109]|uniref:hypothetical protein n=1 Tax=Planococcus sp. ISL-109 TaxID=2819166 RepID=UPI001BE7B911|nr:hypothetical protein [Planococcus sp. ISL-109]MBT2582894.1 hypothetical protein [Planococcus sp. ISL-109]